MNTLKRLVSSTDHAIGDEDAPLLLVQFADFQCQRCGENYGMIKELQEELGPRLRFVFRNFPLRHKHPESLIAAMAVEAAARQRAFWRMHDILFENQQRLYYEDLIEYARAIDLDIDRFSRDFRGPDVSQKVLGDLVSGRVSGVQQTPAFFVNGVLVNISCVEELRASLEGLGYAA